MFNYSKENDVKVYVYRLTNLFGKWCRPNYNSVVATFCNNIANNLPIKINDPEVVMNLAYIDDVLEEFINAKNNKIDSKYREDIVIEENDYNTFERKIFTDIEIARYYFEDYKYKALYNPEKAFNLLDSEYKIEKFNNDINEYKAYIQNNKNNLQNAELIHYKTSKEGQYGIYEVTDNYDNYYKIIETGINEYTIILDNSTSAE